jgi:CHAT domain-containing protein/predicted negative regulator of RcsB-dependent stress response
LLAAALLSLFLPLGVAAQPAEDLAARFIDVLRHDDFTRLPGFLDEQTEPEMWTELTVALDRYDCISIARYDWSPEPAPPGRIAVRVDFNGTGRLKSPWRPERRLWHTWHLEARDVGGSWRLTRAYTEERRVSLAMMAATTAAEVDRLAAEARDVDPLRLIAYYAYELDLASRPEPFEHLLVLARETGDLSTELKVLRSYAGALGPTDPARMLAVARDAEERARQSGTADDLADARLTLGWAQASTGEIEGALKTYAAAAEMAELLDDPTTAIQCLQMVIWVTSPRVSALETLRGNERLLKMVQRYGWEEGEQVALLNRAKTHLELGNLDVARADLLRLIRLSEARGSRSFAAQGRWILAEMELRESHHENAVLHLRAALDLLGDPQRSMVALTILARAQMELGRFAEADEALRKAEAIPEGTPDQWAAVREERSRFHLRLGHAEPAVAAAREGLRRLDVSSGESDSLAVAKLLGALARAYAALGRKNDAIAELRKAVAAIENRQNEIGADPLGRASFLAEYEDLYVELVELLVARGDVGDAFRIAEQMRARGLREAVAASHLDLSATLSAEQRSREKVLEDRVVEINKTLLAARQQKEPVAEIERKLEIARTELNAFGSEIRLEHPAIGRRRIDPDVSSALPGGSPSLALIEYVVAAEQVIAFVVTGDAPIRAVRLPVARRTIEHDARELEALLAARSPGYRAAARRLYAMLLRPLARHIRGKATLAIIPDGALWTVPFHALIAADGRYLIDRHTVFYAYSLSLLRSAAALHTTVPTRLLALGNPTIAGAARTEAKAAFRDVFLGPLLDAETEVKALAAMYPAGQRRVYVRDAATEALFKSDAPGFSVIHIAAHALIDDRAPMYSAIVLSARADADDGLLEAREVADLPLNAGLAVLSACQTARGRVRSGEGVIGLNWSFFAAGCPTTVVSQWNAESEATAALMIELHRRLRAGDTPAAALRAAQRRVRTEERYRHPFYWAPFIAVGAANRALRW